MTHDALIDRRLEFHDRHQLELKLSYLIPPSAAQHRYVVELFMFVPRELGIDEHTYTAQRFYGDMAAFLRVKTPTMSLERFASESEALDWFCKPPDKGQGGEEEGQALSRRLKHLGCLYREASREAMREVLDRVEALPSGVAEVDAPEADVAEVERAESALAEAMQAFLGRLEEAVERLRRFGNECVGAAQDEDRVRQSWAAVDEYSALVTEDACTTILHALDTRSERESACSLRLREAQRLMAAYAHAQVVYRKSRGFISVVKPGKENEHFPYHRRVLKRSVRSVLYFKIRQNDAQIRMTSDLIGMVAAAIAMLFAVTASLWVQVAWSNTWPFVIAMVVSYMIKDRLKEWGRHYLGRRARRWMPDMVSDIQDMRGETIGKCREVVRVVDPKAVDPVVVARRHSRHPNQVAEEGRPEVVVHYTKAVTLSTDKLDAQMEGAEGLNDIIRLNMRRICEYMDDPYEPYHQVKPGAARLRTIQCARVYHVNIVLRLSEGVGQGAVISEEPIRVVLDQAGIRRVVFLDAQRRSRAGNA